jgi:hypothetical protein
MRTRTVESSITDNDEYSRVSVNYENELGEDNFIQSIKKFCFAYLDNPQYIEKFDIDEIEYMLNYILEKFNYLDNLRKSLKIEYFSSPMISISKLLDSMLLSENLECMSYDKSINILQREINYVLEQISMFHGILKQAYELKKISTQN